MSTVCVALRFASMRRREAPRGARLRLCPASSIVYSRLPIPTGERWSGLPQPRAARRFPQSDHTRGTTLGGSDGRVVTALQNAKITMMMPRIMLFQNAPCSAV